MANIEKLKSIYPKFQQALDKPDYTEAGSIFEQINNELTLIEDFSVLSQEELNWLNHLNQEIHSKIPILQQESKELVDKIKPFNKNKSIKDLYSAK